MKIQRKVYAEIESTIGSNTPERGGILGSAGDEVINQYYYDVSAIHNADRYMPDITAINAVLTDQWMPNGTIMVGIVHSHAGSQRFLSCGDLQYGMRILKALDTVSKFYLPIITLEDRIMHMYVYSLCIGENDKPVCHEEALEIV